MRLRELREKAELSQSQMAEILGCSKSVYSRYERAERQPDVDTLCKIADYYKVSLDYLVGRQEGRSETKQRKDNKMNISKIVRSAKCGVLGALVAMGMTAVAE